MNNNNEQVAGEIASSSQPAAPVQQPGDVREAWEYSFTHSSALGKGDTNVGPCLTYDRSTAYGVGCFNQRPVVIGQALTTTRPSTDLHAEIMNLPCKPEAAWGLIAVNHYKLGHRDARHAAAELALSARPSAALTDALELLNKIALWWHADQLEVVSGNVAEFESLMERAELFMLKSRRLAASGGALEVPEDWKETLKLAKVYIENVSSDVGYGFSRPANPNDFSPDAESCSAEEIAAHKAACEAYDKGEYTPERGSEWVGNMHILRAPWGIGSYTMRDEFAESLIKSIEAMISAAPAILGGAE